MIKLNKKASKARRYNWRPNFRNYESLPDIRAVRTQLFLPTVSALMAIVFVIFVLAREYKAMGIVEGIEGLRAEIATYEADHNEKVKLNAEFMRIARTLDEVIEFKKDRLSSSDFLLALSSRLTEGMYLNRVEYLEGRATVEGSVQVPAEEASRIVDAYLKSIKNGDVLQGLLTEYKLTSLKRDDSSNTIKFKIEITEAQEAEK